MSDQLKTVLNRCIFSWSWWEMKLIICC